jgi:hypothetical protein
MSTSSRYVYLQLFQKLGWEQVAALTEDGQKYTEYISHMQDLLQANGITFVANRKFPRDREKARMSMVSHAQFAPSLLYNGGVLGFPELWSSLQSYVCLAVHQSVSVCITELCITFAGVGH